MRPARSPSGSLTDWGPGVSVVCAAKIQAPRITLPIDKTINLCMLRGRADRVEVIDAATGQTLFTTSRKAKEAVVSPDPAYDFSGDAPRFYIKSLVTKARSVRGPA